jgi:uncharacterized protein VirK/YbjX
MTGPRLSLLRKLRKEGPVAVVKALHEFFGEEPLAAAIAGHRQMRALFDQPELRLLKARPGIVRKYLSVYLAKGFSRQTRRQIVSHHYHYLAANAAPDFYARILSQPFVLWRQADEGIPLQIALIPNLGSRYEGELSLVFSAMEISVFELSFTIAPGVVVGSACENVMLIGRVQGGRRFDLIRRATKACEDVSPKNLLMMAAQSFAMALELEAIAGVGNDRQVGNPDSGDPFFLVDYDEFWQTQLAARTGGGFYELPLPLPQKPLSDVSASHRRRARNRRLYKDTVTSVVREAVQTLFLPTGTPMIPPNAAPT